MPVRLVDNKNAVSVSPEPILERNLHANSNRDNQTREEPASSSTSRRRSSNYNTFHALFNHQNFGGILRFFDNDERKTGTTAYHQFETF